MARVIRCKVDLYGNFGGGAKDGFKVAVGIMPCLMAMLLASIVFRASGAFELLPGVLAVYFSSVGIRQTRRVCSRRSG